MSEENKKLVRRITEEVWNKGDLSLIPEIYAPDFVGNAPPETMKGPEGYRELVKKYRTAFPDVQFTIHDLIAEGDKVAVRWSTRSTHKGTLAGIAPQASMLPPRVSASTAFPVARSWKSGPAGMPWGCCSRRGRFHRVRRQEPEAERVIGHSALRREVMFDSQTDFGSPQPKQWGFPAAQFEHVYFYLLQITKTISEIKFF